MKKTFQLRVEGKHPDRLLDAIKHEIRKYLRRERRRELPDGAQFWDFDCRFGASQETAAMAAVTELTRLIDAVVSEGGSQFYVEILARPGVRAPRPPEASPAVEAI